MKTLVIGDAHVKPDENLVRFEWASSLIIDERPDNIVIIGDFLAMDSLCYWDRNKRLTLEGRRYARDIHWGQLALDTLFSSLTKEQDKKRDQHKAMYKPFCVYLEGNHEFWVKRYVEEYAEFEAYLDVQHDLGCPRRNIQYIPYRDDININGVLSTHVPINKGGSPTNHVGTWLLLNTINNYQ
jgi:hypothetical protein